MKVNKKLGFGLMRLPLLDAKDTKSIDLDQMNRMVDLFLERGFTYFDTAWMYHSFQSEIAAGECLVKRHPRDSFTLATKLHYAFFDTLEGRDEIFAEQLRKTGVDYFDYYLLHAVDSESIEKYERLDCFTWLQEKKKAGLARHVGFSFHDKAQVLDKVLTDHPEVDFVQLQLNYLDWENEWVESRKCYETAAAHGKPVVVMEGVKGGVLANPPEKAALHLKALDPARSAASWAIRFAASLPNVMVVLSGMSSYAQLEENTSFMQDFVPLTEEEKAYLLETAEIIRQDTVVPCTGCSYCTDGCPMNIAIPKYFKIYNEYCLESRYKSFTPQKDYYEELTASFGKASDCVECGQCEGACPQHLSIIDYLKDVAKAFES